MGVGKQRSHEDPGYTRFLVLLSKVLWGWANRGPMKILVTIVPEFFSLVEVGKQRSHEEPGYTSFLVLLFCGGGQTEVP